MKLSETAYSLKPDTLEELEIEPSHAVSKKHETSKAWK